MAGSIWDLGPHYTEDRDPDRDSVGENTREQTLG